MIKAYLYPEFHRAKRLLCDAIKNNPKEPVEEIVERFFRVHFFQVGVTDHVSRFDLDRLKGDDLSYLEFRKQQAFVKMGQEILQNGFYYETINNNGIHRTNEFRILIFGNPTFVGEGTREAQDKRDNE